jgi:hypothetical protein
MGKNNRFGQKQLHFISSFLVLTALVFGLWQRSAAQTCEVVVSPAVRDAEFDAIFTQNGPGQGLEPAGSAGWTGGDSTYSVGLPNGDTAFFFSDSYIGEYPAFEGDGTVTANANGLRTRQSNCGPPICDPPTVLYRAHNSVVVRDHVTGTLRTLTGPKDVAGYSTSYFSPLLGAVTNTFFWMGDSAVVQTDAAGTKKLWVFLLEFNNAWEFKGTSVAQLSLPGLQIESIKSITPALGTASPISWGAAAWLEGEYGNRILYIYGMFSDNTIGKKRPFLARVNPDLGFDSAADSTNWTVWNGSDWVAGLGNAAPLIGAAGDPNNANDSISDEFSVKKIQTNSGTSYVLLGMDTTAPFGLWKDITLYTSCSPQGPFSAKQIVYSTPETNSRKVPGMTDSESLAGGMFVYNPHLHPQFSSSNNILISYNSNASKSQDLLFADTYRPRFIRAQVNGLNTTVTVGGKVMTQNGSGNQKTGVTMTSPDGTTKTVSTDEAGNYRFEGVFIGKTYTFQAFSKHEQFAPKTVKVLSAINDLDFSALP